MGEAFEDVGLGFFFFIVNFLRLRCNFILKNTNQKLYGTLNFYLCIHLYNHY